MMCYNGSSLYGRVTKHHPYLTTIKIGSSQMLNASGKVCNLSLSFSIGEGGSLLVSIYENPYHTN